MEGVNLSDLFERVSRWIANVTVNIVWSVVLRYVVIGLVVVISVGACILVWREVMTQVALAPHRRRRYLVRSIGPHEWPMEELERWAAQLSMVRRRVRRLQDRPAHAVRLRLEATPHGSRYTMESSWRFERVMHNPALSGVSITRLRPRPAPGSAHDGPSAPSTPPPRS